MYAVIKTGGKQYRVQAGDLLVVEKLDAEPGAAVAFDQVLMLGEGAAVTVGAPTVAGAKVSGTLIETRKGEKIKVFKKIRRQGYRRTRGHRQLESVVRVTAIAGEGVSDTWDGAVDVTPLATLQARARNLARGMEAAEARRAEREGRKARSMSAPTPASKPVKSKTAKTETARPEPSEAKPVKVKSGGAKSASSKTSGSTAAPAKKKTSAAAGKADAAKAAANKSESKPSAKAAKPKAKTKKD